MADERADPEDVAATRPQHGDVRSVRVGPAAPVAGAGEPAGEGAHQGHRAPDPDPQRQGHRVPAGRGLAGLLGALAARLALWGFLAWGVWAGSRIALVGALAILFFGIELLVFTMPSGQHRRG